MKASTAEESDDHCPCCGGRVARALKGQPFRRHLHRKADGTLCDYERGQKD